MAGIWSRDQCSHVIGQVAGSNGDVEMAPLRGSIQRASFTGLKKDGRYTVKVSFVYSIYIT